MHPDALLIDDAQAKSLIVRSFPELDGLPLRRPRTPGTVNTIIRVGADLVARFPLLATGERELRAEAEAMTELAAASPVPAPRPYGVGAPSEGFASAWSLLSWIPGETADPERFSSSVTLADDVATFISALRNAPVRGRVFDGRGRGGDLADHDEWVQTCLARSAHLIDAARVRRLWGALRPLPSAGPDVMSHRDLTPFNLLVDGERLIGVLDGGDFGAADRALDLVAAWHLFDAPARAVVRAGVAADETQWLRGAAWALQQALGLIWYYERSNPAMSLLGRSTVRRLLGDAELRPLAA